MVTKAIQTSAVLLTEFIGTGFLVLIIGLGGLTKIGLGAFDALAVGSILTVMVYMGGHVSGANYNPAVTLALCVRGKLSPLIGLQYVVAQISGALAFGLIAQSFVRGDSGGDMEKEVMAPFKVGLNLSPFQALLAEFVFTFSLTNVVLRTATLSTVKGNSYFGLSIGFTVLSGAISVGGISGACFNPAASVLNILAGFEGATVGDYWLYWLGPLLGGSASGLLFRFTNPEEIKDVHTSPNAAAPYIVEFIGTFMLCFTISTAAAPNVVGNLTAHFAPLAIGSMLMTQVYAGGPTSGGHYNPAVTIGAFMRFRLANDRKSLAAPKVAGYIATQCAAALLAGACGLLALDGASAAQMPFHTIGAPYPSDVSIGWALAAEALGTFALVLVVLNVATAKDVDKNSYFGIAIGFTVQAMAYGVGSISGGAFNPAVGLLQVINSGRLNFQMVSKIWIFWVGPYMGGVCAALAFHLQSMALAASPAHQCDAADSSPSLL